MHDWKDTLSALTGVQTETTDNQGKTSQCCTEKKVNKKKRAGVVYSTNPDYEYTDDIPEELATQPKSQQKLRLNMERAGRGGKTVTIVKGFVGTSNDLCALGRLLKQKCGVGGSVKDGEIIVQGDHRCQLIEILKSEGFTQTK